MASKCPNCGKGSRMATYRVLLRGNYNPTAKHRQKPNLQWARLPADKAGIDGKRIKMCTDCIKKLSKAPRVRGGAAVVQA